MKLCIVAHFAYGALAGGESGHVGGVERQTSLTAKWLAARGHIVSIITWDEGQPQDHVVDGVRVIKLCRQSAGIPGVRFFYPRWTSLWAALKKADADIYYHNCGEYITGQLALWAWLHKKIFVYSTANDADCDPRLPQMHTLRERVFYKYGLNKADLVIAQTEKQQRMLQDGFGVQAKVLPMPCPSPSVDEWKGDTGDVDKEFFRVGWAARISDAKRLELLVEVARELPQVIFEVGGAPFTEKDQQYARPILEVAATVPNIILIGRISRDKMPEFYQRINLFCSTSAYEGFPNTFLEAWSHGLPIVSTFDPDGLIARYELGRAVDDVAGLVAGIQFFLDHPEELKRISVQTRSYYLGNHTVDQVMSRYERLFMERFEDLKGGRCG